MNFFEYLLWILLVGYGYLVAARLMWLYRNVEGHVFWQKANAKTYHIVAAILFFVFVLSLSQIFHAGLLLLFMLGEYLLVAAPAVKMSDRGILANAFMVRWPDVVQGKKMSVSGEIVLATKHPWQRIRLQVPADKEAAFRKILAAKGVAIVDEEAEKIEAQILPASAIATKEENQTRKPEDGVIVENLA
ncbi:MAG: hypothetical protein ACRENG_21515 [bacterium]